MQTKSGTNEIQGSAFGFRQHDKFQARNPFTQPERTSRASCRRRTATSSAARSAARSSRTSSSSSATTRALRSTVGGSRADGPDGARAHRRPERVRRRHLRPAERRGTPATRTQFPGNVIPTGRLRPQALAILNLLPLPNAPGTVNGTRDNYLVSGSETFNSDAFDVRLDGRLSDSMNIFGRYSYAKFDKDSPTAFGDAGGGGGFAEPGRLLEGEEPEPRAGPRLHARRTTDPRRPLRVVQLQGGRAAARLRHDARRRRRHPGPQPRRRLHVGALRRQHRGQPGPAPLRLRPRRQPLQLPAGPGRVAVADRGQLHQDPRHDHTVKVGIDVRRAYNLRVPSDSHRVGRAAVQRQPHDRADGRRPRARHVPARRRDVLQALRQPDHGRARAAVAAASTTSRTPGGRQQADPQLRPAPRGDHPETVNEPGNGGWPNARAWLEPATRGEILVGGVGDVDLAGNVENTLNWEPRLGVTYQINDKTVVRAGYGRSYDIGIFGSTFGHAVTQNLPVLVDPGDQRARQLRGRLQPGAGPAAARRSSPPRQRPLPAAERRQLLRARRPRCGCCGPTTGTSRCSASSRPTRPWSWATWATTASQLHGRRQPRRGHEPADDRGLPQRPARPAAAVLRPLRLDAGLPLPTATTRPTTTTRSRPSSPRA